MHQAACISIDRALVDVEVPELGRLPLSVGITHEEYQGDCRQHECPHNQSDLQFVKIEQSLLQRLFNHAIESTLYIPFIGRIVNSLGRPIPFQIQTNPFNISLNFDIAQPLDIPQNILIIGKHSKKAWKRVTRHFSTLDSYTVKPQISLSHILPSG